MTANEKKNNKKNTETFGERSKSKFDFQLINWPKFKANLCTKKLFFTERGLKPLDVYDECRRSSSEELFLKL